MPKSENLLRLELPYRDTLDLRRTLYEGGEGPHAAIVSGIHGDELEGLYVCHRLAHWLERHRSALVGRVSLIPAANPLGLATLKRVMPVFETDINRNFPGHPKGLLPQRLAHALMETVNDAALVIDIHASNTFLREIPQVRINELFAKQLMPLARHLNLDVVWLHGSLTVMEATLFHSLNVRDVRCLVVEMGVGLRITPAFTDQVVLGILHVWRELGVLAQDTELPPLTHHPLIANDANVHYLNAERSGLFVPQVEHWQNLRKGDLLGKIVSAYRGEVLSEVRSPVSGILFTLREYPLVYEGSLLARIRAEDNLIS